MDGDMAVLEDLPDEPPSLPLPVQPATDRRPSPSPRAVSLQPSLNVQAMGENLVMEESGLTEELLSGWQRMDYKMEAFLRKQNEWTGILEEQMAIFTAMHEYVRERMESGTPPETYRVTQQTRFEDSNVHILDMATRTVQRGGSSLQSEDTGGFSRESSHIAVELQDYNHSRLTRLSGPVQTCTCPSVQEGLVPCVLGVCKLILEWRYFEMLMGFIITLNAANIGWAIDKELKGHDVMAHNIVENIFLAIFIVEIAMRIAVKGLICLRVPWNFFDFLLVLITASTEVLAPVFENDGSMNQNFLQQVLILRMTRLLRLARAVRLVATFRPLWKLAKGLTDCFATMFSALVLMFITIYIFACIGAEFIAKQLRYDADPVVAGLVEESFSSMPRILLTLMRFTTMDSTYSFYGPLIYNSPWLVLYFLLLFIVVAIAMMNLITALLVEDAIDSAKTDQEMKMVTSREKVKTLKPVLRDFFQSLDVSGDGFVQIKEVVECARTGVNIPHELREVITPARMLDLFDVLDADNSGDLSENEFVDGLLCVAVTDMPRETLQVLQLLRSIRTELRRTMKPQFSTQASNLRQSLVL